jgi:electron transfer flavoprotein beta subunit
MSIAGVLDCFDKPLTVLTYEDLKDEPLIDATTIGLKGSPTNIAKSFTPPQKGAGVMITGADDAAMVTDLTARLSAKHIL